MTKTEAKNLLAAIKNLRVNGYINTLDRAAYWQLVEALNEGGWDFFEGPRGGLTLCKL